MERRKKIFDDGATVVEEVITNKKKKFDMDDTPVKIRNTGTKTIQVTDVLDTFAGYLPTKANFMPKDGGECLICGKETSSSMRKICFDCLQRNGEELYNKAQKSIEIGDKEFQI